MNRWPPLPDWEEWKVPNLLDSWEDFPAPPELFSPLMALAPSGSVLVEPTVSRLLELVEPDDETYRMLGIEVPRKPLLLPKRIEPRRWSLTEKDASTYTYGGFEVGELEIQPLPTEGNDPRFYPQTIQFDSRGSFYLSGTGAWQAGWDNALDPNDLCETYAGISRWDFPDWQSMEEFPPDIGPTTACADCGKIVSTGEIYISQEFDDRALCPMCFEKAKVAGRAKLSEKVSQ